MAFLRFFLSTCFCLSLCSSQLICDVTQDQDQTTYTISNADTNKCDYFWTNENRTVLAHNKDADRELVKSHDVLALITYQCIPLVIYEQTCHPKGERLPANCTISCPEKAVPPEDQASSPEKAVPPEHQGWIAAVVIVLVVVVLLCVFIKKVKSCRNKAGANDVEMATTGVDIQTKLLQKTCPLLSSIRCRNQAGDLEADDIGAADVDAKDELL